MDSQPLLLCAWNYYGSNFNHQPGVWNKGNHFSSSRWPLAQLMGSLGTCRVWVRFPTPQRMPSLTVPFELANHAESNALYQESSQGVGKASGSNEWADGWDTQQVKTLLNYTAINYLKHHLENHSALLLPSGKQILVTNTEISISKKDTLPENPEFFALYSCWFRSIIALGWHDFSAQAKAG